MPKRTKRTVYQDKKTGRFVSEATWKRSRARGGKRYVRKTQHKTSRTPSSRRGDVRAVARRRPARPPKKTEYQINVRYTATTSNSVEVQIAAIGPPNRNRKQVLRAVDFYLAEENDGENLPGWTVHIVFWEKHGVQFFGDDEVARRQLRFFLRDADLEVIDTEKDKAL